MTIMKENKGGVESSYSYEFSTTIFHILHHGGSPLMLPIVNQYGALSR